MYVSPNSGSRADLLVIDDTLANLRLLVNLLRENGYKVRAVSNGYEALETIQKSPPDLILLDILMPDLSGYEVCKRLKLDVNTQDIPIIFLSALSDGLDKVKAFTVGGSDYITKPFQVEEVLARVKNQLTIQWHKKQLQLEILEREQAQEALRVQYQREQALNRVIRSIRNSLEISTVFSTAVTEIGQLLQADWVAIVQHFSQHRSWQPIVEYFPNSDLAKLVNAKLSSPRYLLTERLKLLQTFCVENPQEILDEFNQDLVEQYPRIWLQIPVYSDGEVWGSLSIVRHHSVPWSETDVELAVVVTDQLAIAIGQSQLYQQLHQVNQELEHLANLDGLTQVANRRRFDRVLEQEWLRLRREKLPLSLILADIDYFKLYNDTYGHLAGDDCLRQVAQTIHQTLKRPADVVARYGGEEFAVILPNTSLPGALQVAEHIRQAVFNLQLTHQASPGKGVITLSLGVSSLIPPMDEEQQILIQKADQALYKAKKQGKNIVCKL
ncbi:putative diguanylate cyclase (GGDEF domain) [Planktothrix serta PCC 8927]|uniref:Diguanylate cyclase (GGDEF domain) n=1 Tax=Planktothrix serta PCC 8927 TaxID=671068 RepID=A0A7Z9BIM6_9CYAN|nr:diguanylate cyclase [Planktothrix serta]VXD12280.1 putative diguanylate cyclase (GGDEF domain) [Planktothrix serta PCC 8927]